MRRILKGLLALAAAMTAGGLLAGNISVNFATGKNKTYKIGQTSTYGIFPTHGWIDVAGNSGKDVDLDPVGAIDHAKLTWSAPGTYEWTTATDTVLKGYLDDNNDRISIKVTQIPFACYDVIIYQATDDDAKFNPPKVNGLYYSYDGKLTSTKERDEGLRYGQSHGSVAEVGRNVVSLTRFTGDLQIEGCKPVATATGVVSNQYGRGCIAAFQIVERQRQCWGNLGFTAGAGTIADKNYVQDMAMTNTYDLSFGDQTGLSYTQIGMYGDVVIREFRLALASTDPLAPDSIEITDGETTIISTKTDTRSGTVYGAGDDAKNYYTRNIATYFFDSDVSFNTSKPLKVKMNVAGGWPWRGMGAKPKNNTFSDGTWSPVFLLSGEYKTPRSIAVNFNSNQGNARGGSGAIPAGAWNNVAGATTNDMPLVRNDDDEEASGALLTSSGKTHYWANATEPFLKGYVDDNAAIDISVKNIPFEYYDVIVYQATDTANYGFNPPSINGHYFSYDGKQASKTPNDPELKYGVTRLLAPTYGKNVVYVPGGFPKSQPLTIVGAGNANGARGCIAAIQIVEAEPPTYSATVSANTAWSNISWIPKQPDFGFEENAKLTLTVVGSPEISFDEPFALGVCSTVTIKGTPVLKAADAFYQDGCWERAVVSVGTFSADGATFPTTFKEGFAGKYAKSDSGFSLRAQNKEVISVNLAGGSITPKGTFPPEASPAENLVPKTDDYYGLAPTPGSSWNNVDKMWKNMNTNVMLVAAQAFDGVNTIGRPTFSMTAAANTTWQASSIANPFMRGYLDDAGDGASIVIHGIPYTAYDVIVYGVTDAAATPHAPVVVNGKSYTFKDGETVEGTSDWGVGLNGDPAFGKNALRITQCAGDTLLISGQRTTSGRATISAVQIVCQGVVTNRETFTATVSESTSFSKISWDGGKEFHAGQLNEVTINVKSTSGEVEIAFDDADMMLGKLTLTGSCDIRMKADKPLPNVGRVDVSKCKGKITYAWPVTSLQMTTDGKIAYVGGSGSEAAPAPVSFVADGDLTLAETNAPYYVGSTYNAKATAMPYTMTFTNAEVHADGAINSNGNTGLGVGNAAITVAGTSVVTAQNIALSHGQKDLTSSLTVKDEAQVVATGTVSQDGNLNSVMFGHWNGPTTFTLQDSASFTAASDVLVGKTGNNHTINILGGTFTACGIKASSSATGTNIINLNGGELVLGETGISWYGATKRAMPVTVGGDAKITSSAAMPIAQDVTVNAGKTLTFDAAGGVITLGGTLVNNGTNVIARGTVKLNGSYQGSGPIIVRSGATFDYGGKYIANEVVVEDGGAVVNSGAPMMEDNALSLTLAGDAVVGGPSNILYGANAQVKLNGHALAIARDGCLSLAMPVLTNGTKIVVGAETDGTLATAGATELKDMDVEMTTRGTLDLSKGVSLTCRDFTAGGQTVGSAARLIVTGKFDASNPMGIAKVSLADGATLVGAGLRVSDSLAFGSVLYVESARLKPGKIAEVPEGTQVDKTAVYYNGRPGYALSRSGTSLSVVYYSNNWIDYADGGCVHKEGNAYVVTNAEGLAWIAASAASGWFTTNVVLDADIDLSLWNWTPIAQFAGVFDGRGHTVTGLNNTNVVEDLGEDGRYVGGPTNDWGYSAYGLFATATNAAFRNVSLADVAICNGAESVAALLGVHAGGDLSVVNVTNVSGRICGTGRAVAGLLTVGGKGDPIGDVVVTGNVNRATIVGAVANDADGGNVAQVLAGTTWGTTFGAVVATNNVGAGEFDVSVTDGAEPTDWTESGFSWFRLPVCNFAPAVIQTDSAMTFWRYVEANAPASVPVDPVYGTARMSAGALANGADNVAGRWTDTLTAIPSGGTMLITNKAETIDFWDSVFLDRDVTIDLKGNCVYAIYDCEAFVAGPGVKVTVKNGCVYYAHGYKPDVDFVDVKLAEIPGLDFYDRTVPIGDLEVVDDYVVIEVPFTSADLYYCVDSIPSLEANWKLAAYELGNGGTLTILVPAAGASGFYRVRITDIKP